ncbi:MAG TPA: UbiD family decarboxylase, partial [Nitrososphaerales archaeon]|nr:UbiD family decarboxylase [Nitrososphaerales archaeon]
GEEADITKFPIPVTSELDDAPYVTAGITVVRDPAASDPQSLNLGIYRHKLIDRRKLGLYYSWGKYIHRVHRKAEEANRPMDVAICIGTHPALYYAATDQAHLTEYSLAGAFQGEAVELVKCETSDLLVPANSEIVVEARLMPKARQTEGPFGEYAGFYGEVVDAPLAEITCITHREDPVYYFVPSGRHAEHLSGGLGAVLGACATVKKQYPSVQAISKPWRLSFVVGVRMEKLNEGDPVTVGVLTSSLSQYNKYVIVVDGSVDIFDERELMWAVATRCRADESFTLIPNSRGNRLDPSSYNSQRTDRGAMVTKVIIDATRKFLSSQGTTEISEPMVDSIDPSKFGLTG